MPQLGLPSPRRTVNKGLALCRRLGLTDDQAIHMIDAACQAALDRIEAELNGYPNWIKDVQVEARLRYRHFGPGRPARG